MGEIMQLGFTNKTVEIKGEYGTYTVPKGTRVNQFKGESSVDWVVSSVADSIKAGMSEHDAMHRYIFVPADAVTALLLDI